MNKTRLIIGRYGDKTLLPSLHWIALHVPVDQIHTVSRPDNACVCVRICHKRDASAIWIILDRVTNVKLCIHICKHSLCLPCPARNTATPLITSIETRICLPRLSHQQAPFFSHLQNCSRSLNTTNKNSSSPSFQHVMSDTDVAACSHSYLFCHI